MDGGILLTCCVNGPIEQRSALPALQAGGRWFEPSRAHRTNLTSVNNGVAVRNPYRTEHTDQPLSALRPMVDTLVLSGG